MPLIFGKPLNLNPYIPLYNPLYLFTSDSPSIAPAPPAMEVGNCILGREYGNVGVGLGFRVIIEGSSGLVEKNLETVYIQWANTNIPCWQTIFKAVVTQSHESTYQK